MRPALLALAPAVALAAASAASALPAPPAAPPPAPVHARQEPAPPDDAAAWIARGRALLARGLPAEAETAFERAAERAAHEGTGSLEPRMWVLRSWMDAGRVNDALRGADALAAEGLPEVELDYLYGMAWLRAAEAKVRQDVGGTALRRNLVDAFERLSAATAAAPERFGDAFHPLAKVAWMLARPDAARAAAEAAVRHEPENPRAWHLLGRLALERHELARPDPGSAAEAETNAARALEALGRAAELLASPATRYERALRSETHLQLVRLHLGRGRPDEAAAELTGAVAWQPDRPDYRSLRDRLPTDAFRSALADGLAAFEARVSQEDAEDDTAPGQTRAAAPARWWLGYERFRAGDLAGAERSFRRALESGREDVRSARYYLARLCYTRDEPGRALDLLRASFELDPAELLARLESDPAFTVPMLDRLGAWARAEGRRSEATIAWELHAELVRRPEAWTRLGTWLAAEARELRAADPTDAPTTGATGATGASGASGAEDTEAAACDAATLEAFERAVLAARGAPRETAGPLLDLARHLHHLDRGPGRTRELYERAKVAARRALDAPADGSPEGGGGRRALEDVLRGAREGLARLAAEQEAAGAGGESRTDPRGDGEAPGNGRRAPSPPSRSDGENGSDAEPRGARKGA